MKRGPGQWNRRDGTGVEYVRWDRRRPIEVVKEEVRKEEIGKEEVEKH